MICGAGKLNDCPSFEGSSTSSFESVHKDRCFISGEDWNEEMVGDIAFDIGEQCEDPLSMSFDEKSIFMVDMFRNSNGGKVVVSAECVKT